MQTPPLRITRRHAVLLLAGGATCLSASHAITSPFSFGPFSFGLDIHGQSVFSLADAHTQFVTTLFVATDCPISNRYLPLLVQLAHQFAPRGVRLWLVYPNPGDTLAAVRAHQSQYPAAASLPQLIAPDPRFLAHAHVHVTPEAAIFRADAAGVPFMTHSVLWHGRIDDRYLTFGTQRPAATRHDLADALTDALAGRRPTPPAAPPVGCAIIPRA
jgi:hypothetical protein